MASVRRHEENIRKTYSYHDYIPASDVLVNKGMMKIEHAESFIRHLIDRIVHQLSLEGIKRSKLGGSPYILRPEPNNPRKKFKHYINGKEVEGFVGKALVQRFGKKLEDHTEYGVFDFKVHRKPGYVIYFEVKWVKNGEYMGSEAQERYCTKLTKTDFENSMPTFIFYIMVSHDCQTVHIVYPKKKELVSSSSSSSSAPPLKKLRISHR